MPLPNKCDYCGLRRNLEFTIPGATTASDSMFVALRHLYDGGIISTKYVRKVTEPRSSTEFCIVSAEAWGHNEVPCSRWLLRDEGLKIADYLAMDTARANNDLTEASNRLSATNNKLTRVSNWMAMAALLISLVALVVALK